MPDLTCPLPITDCPNVPAHGASGQLMHQLLDTLIVPVLGPAPITDSCVGAAAGFPRR